MPYTLQMLRALMEDHPDRVGNLRIHVESLENSIENQPAFCLQSVRTLFETVQLTIAPIIGVDLSGVTEFPARNGRIVKALDFSIRNHPDAAEIDAVIKKLLGSINGTISALAELSNIPGLRHGGSLDWGTLQRQHARMLGGLCDALVRFLFDVAWSRPSADAPEPEPNSTTILLGSMNGWMTNTAWSRSSGLGSSPAAFCMPLIQPYTMTRGLPGQPSRTPQRQTRRRLDHAGLRHVPADL